MTDYDDPRQLLDLAILAKNYRRYEEAIRYFKQVIKTEDYSIGEPNFRRMIYCYLEIGNSYSNLSEYDDAIEYYKKGLEIAELRNEDDLRISIYIGIAEVKFYEWNFQESIEYYKKALELVEVDTKMDNKLRNTFKVRSYLGIANIYRNQKSYSSSIEYYKKGLEIARTQPINEQRELLKILYKSLADVYSLNKDYNQAIIFHEKSLSIDY